jgi:hypothetical protein
MISVVSVFDKARAETYLLTSALLWARIVNRGIRWRFHISKPTCASPAQKGKERGCPPRLESLSKDPYPSHSHTKFLTSKPFTGTSDKKSTRALKALSGSHSRLVQIGLQPAGASQPIRHMEPRILQGRIRVCKEEPAAAGGPIN